MNEQTGPESVPALHAGDGIKDRLILVAEGVPLNGRDPDPLRTEVTFSEGLPEWLHGLGVSVAFTTYDSGGLHLVGQDGAGKLTLLQNRVVEASGLAYNGKQLCVGTRTSVRVYKDINPKGKRHRNIYDKVFVHRVGYTTGILDIHELNFDNTGQLYFVNSRFSCVATLHPVHAFVPVWKPHFITTLVSEDRCHLNGMAFVDGELRYVSAFIASDGGWRGKENDKGIVMDTRANAILAEGFIKPHSPRYHQGAVWILDSGRGHLVRIDEASGNRDNVVFIPGFLKGLSFFGRYAALTSSRPRDESFIGMELDGTLKARGQEPWCAVFFVDIVKGAIVHWIRLNGRIREMLDVKFLTDARCPWVGVLTSIGASGGKQQTAPAQPTAAPALRPAAAE